MKVGDVVYLKNDGAALVVKSLDETTSEATVLAHDANGRVCTQTYPVACLTETKPE